MKQDKQPYSGELLRDIYLVMKQIRLFEETSFRFFQENKLRGSVHLCIGQEAISASVIGLLNDGDYITSTHRGHGHGIAKSRDLKSAFSELMGKDTGFCRGRGGSMHICDLAKGNLGANAIVGGGIPIAVGGALAQKMRKTGHITVSFFGDGASNQGTFHESLNLASVWKLPLVFVCENNQFAITVPVSQSTSVKDIADRAAAYAMPGKVVDGNDVIAILDAFSEFKERARKGEGPSLIEAKTYRWKGHWTGDPEVYRTKEEVAAWMEKCPIKRFRKYLLDNGIATEAELKAIDNQAQDEVDEAAQFALNAPEPDPAQVMDGMYVEGGEPR
ncbi:MAG: thiamine pyrophosphate-dependent dehydrogenase E1 component subunit alpha [Spirochaetaceae bacterium]|nr:thiamine pyrophosphate-dependent dehydrogenase E1 component subunit alpha [Spirochaetaceae bacterium]